MSEPAVEESVRYEVRDGVAVITLARPPVNAMSVAVQSRIAELSQLATKDEHASAVVLHGEGRGFSAGLDIGEMAEMNGAQMMLRVQQMQDEFTSVARIPKPVVVAIHGFAMGGGLELACCADRRVASRSARFGMPEVNLGIIPGAGGTQRLPRIVGPSAAKDLVFSGRQIGTREAYQLGLVDEVAADDDDCLHRAMEWAKQFTQLPIWSVRWSKEAIDTGLEEGLQTGLLIESTGFTALFGTEDRRQRMRAFLDRPRGGEGVDS